MKLKQTISLFLACLALGASAQNKKPNILIIMVDDVAPNSFTS